MSTSTFLVLASVALALLGLPLALKLVPPNRIYGFGTSQKLTDRDLWFRVNRFAGWAFVVAGAVSASIFLQHPVSALGAAYGIAAFVVPLLIALGATGAYAKSVSGRKDDVL